MAYVKVQISITSGAFSSMISQTAEYALRAIVSLANEQGVPCTTAQLAEATKTPAGYLAKVMQSLGRAGLITSRRGLNGGFVLRQDPSEITLLTIVNAVDPIKRYPECPLGIASHGRSLCPLHRRLDQAAAMVEQAFGQTTVQELLTTSRERSCKFPLHIKSPS